MTEHGAGKKWDFGWHPDPDHPGQERYWNGSEWTDHRPMSESAVAGEREGDPDRTNRTIAWAIGAGIAILAIIVIVAAVVLIDDGSKAIDDDDDSEFREVTITECDAPGALTPQQVHGVAENGSSERSDYRIEVAVLAPDGTRIGIGSTDVLDVEPGQRAVWTSETDAAEQVWEDGSTCEVLSVERTASF
jgi:hypothetical protein